MNYNQLAKQMRIENRKIGLKTIWERIKIRPLLLLFAFQGIAFSLFLFLPMSFMMTSMANEFPVVSNADQITQNGKEAIGVLTKIETKENVTINGNNPLILHYKYNQDGSEFSSKFSVFEPEKTANLKVGDSIEIKYMNNDSIIKGYEQYSFGSSFNFVYYVGAVFLFVGILFVILIYRVVRKEIDLYKSGKLAEGEVVSITSNRGYTFSKFGKSMTIHYEYDTTNGAKQMGKSRTNNFALTNNKSMGSSVRILVSKDGTESCLYPELIARRKNWK